MAAFFRDCARFCIIARTVFRGKFCFSWNFKKYDTAIKISRARTKDVIDGARLYIYNAHILHILV